MMKSIVNKFLKAALDEVFVDAGNVQMSMGADLFSESTIHLKNLTFRPDIFDVCFQPLQLISGHLGKLSVDGIAELAFGAGKIRCQVENVFLLFGVDENADAEQVQIMKKLLLELQGRGPISRSLLRDLLKKVQGFPTGKDPDVRKKRKLLLKGLNYVFKNLMINIKSVHIRIEIKNRMNTNPSEKSESINSMNKDNVKSSKSLCSAIGMTIPQFKLSPHSSGIGIRPDGVGKDDPILSLSLKSLQVYCDYDCESYSPPGALPSTVLKEFLEKWKTEVHTGLILPFDAEIVIAAEVNRRSGLFSVKLSITIPKIRFICDPRQLEVMKDIIEGVVHQCKRIYQLSRVENIFSTNRLPPKVCEMGGIHILPGLTLRPPLGSKNKIIETKNNNTNINTNVNNIIRNGNQIGNQNGNHDGNHDGNQNSDTGFSSIKGQGPKNLPSSGISRGPNPGVNNGILKNPNSANVALKGNIVGGSSFSLSHATSLFNATTNTNSTNNTTSNTNSTNNTTTNNSSNNSTPGKSNPNILFSSITTSASTSNSTSVPIQLLKYPTHTSLPRASSPNLSETLKALMKKRWAAAMWRHCISLVILDIRQAQPLGRWFELARLSLIRREYAFMYSKLLRRSNDTGNFVLNVNAKIESKILSKLFRYEMILPIRAVVMFRSMANMIAFAELFNTKRREARQSGTHGLPYERTNIMWADILRIHSKLSETQRETFLHRPERERGVGPYDDNDFDDNASNNSDESCSRSVRSHRSNAPSVRSSFGPSSAYNSNPSSPHGSARSSFINNTSQHNNNSSNSSHGFYNNSSTHSTQNVIKTIKGSVLPLQQTNNSNSNNYSNSNSNSNSTSTASKLTSFFGMSSSSSGTTASTSSSTAPLGGGGGGGGGLGILGGLSSASHALGLSGNNVPNKQNNSGSSSGSIPSSLSKIFAGLSIPGMQTDDLDSKLLGRSDLKAFGDFFGGIFESEERSDDHSMDNHSTHSGGGYSSHGFGTGTGIGYVSGPLTHSHSLSPLEVHDWELGGDSPSLHTIEEAVRWATMRYSTDPRSDSLSVDLLLEDLFNGVAVCSSV